ncbi:MAG: response regulator [Desulfovibrio sp.]|nr:response regulator [Desulfovibrio sp.]
MEKVLIVDDDDSYRYSLEKVLSRAGYDTQGASNGKEALKMLTAFKPAVVVTDIIMPDMDGLELVLEVSKRGNVKGIITISGFVEPSNKLSYLDTALEFGASYAFSKPVNMDQLVESVGKILHES